MITVTQLLVCLLHASCSGASCSSACPPCMACHSTRSIQSTTETSSPAAGLATVIMDWRLFCSANCLHLAQGSSISPCHF